MNREVHVIDGVNGKEFANAKEEFSAREDYNDRWLACVTQWKRVLRLLTLSDLVATYAETQAILRGVEDLRVRATLLFGPAGDHELIDMNVQYFDRLEAYSIEVRSAMQ